MDNTGKKEFAYKIIKDKIFEGVLPPLSDISEEKLQTELEIGRTPIREAIQQLSKEGFIYIYPRKGTIVTDTTADLIYEIYEVRELNEPYITQKACGRLSSNCLIEMRNAFLNPPSELSTYELRRYYIDLDRKLHLTILESCNNHFLKNVMTNIYDHTHRIRIKMSLLDDRYEQSIQEHLAIIDALINKDAAACLKASKEHIAGSKKVSFKVFLED